MSRRAPKSLSIERIYRPDPDRVIEALVSILTTPRKDERHATQAGLDATPVEANREAGQDKDKGGST